MGAEVQRHQWGYEDATWTARFSATDETSSSSATLIGETSYFIRTRVLRETTSMSTSQTQSMLYELEAKLPIPLEKRAYFHARVLNSFYQFVLSKFLEEERAGRLTTMSAAAVAPNDESCSGRAAALEWVREASGKRALLVWRSHPDS